jgi:hypothetical protein
MGYTTDFNGSLILTPAATQVQSEYIEAFSRSRRMGRKVDELMKVHKGKHGLPASMAPSKEQQSLLDDLGKSGLSVSVKVVADVDGRTPEEIYGQEGEFFVGDGETGVIDHNTAPGQVPYIGISNFTDRYAENNRRSSAGECQPGLWCQWVLENDGTELLWDGGEKFYNYVEWLQYMITKFFNPWGIKLNGTIEWHGEDRSDMGQIVVTDSVIKILVGTITFEEED